MERNKRKNTVDINVDYFEAIVAKSGKGNSAFGKWLGYGDSFVCNVKKRKTTSESTAKYICAMCNADYERLVIPEKSQEPEQEEKKPLYADDKTLSGIIETLMRIEKKLDELYAELH